MNRPFVLIRDRDRDHPTPQHPLCLYLFSVGLEYAGEALVRSGFAVETVDLLPLYHAKEVCRALIQDGLGEKIRWYCYCAPLPFDQELAKLMKRAGCVGINFGVDSLDESQLAGPAITMLATSFSMI